MINDQIILDPGASKRKPIVIKTEVHTRPNLCDYGHQKNGKRLDQRPTMAITLPRIDALKGGQT